MSENSLVANSMVVISGIIMYLIILMAIGPVLDMWIYDVIPMLDMLPWAQKMVNEFIVFAHWIYIIIKLSIALFILWFIVGIFRKYRYIRQEDELDFYK
jgi:ethanolamine transporter EutH